MSDNAVSYAYQTPEGGWRVVGTRVSLDSIIHAYWEGLSPEAIVQEFPSLSLEQVHGALAFYLHNREAMDRYLVEQEALWERLRNESSAANRDLLERLKSRRQETSSRAQRR